MGCAVCAGGAAQAVGTESLPGDWGPIEEAGITSGAWLRPIGTHAPYLACRRCHTLWQIGWDTRDLIHWSVTELPPGAEVLLRAGTSARAAVRTAVEHRMMHGTLDHYLWDATYDVAAAVDALLEVVLPLRQGRSRSAGAGSPRSRSCCAARIGPRRRRRCWPARTPWPSCSGRPRRAATGRSSARRWFQCWPGPRRRS